MNNKFIIVNYHHLNFGGKSEDEMMELMLKWFHAHYKDPTHNALYAAKEGVSKYI